MKLPDWIKYYRASRKSIGSQARQERIGTADIAKQMGHATSKMAEQHYYSVLEVETMRGVGSGMVLSLAELKKKKTTKEMTASG